MQPIVKICGLKTPETLAAALDAGADMVGFVFFPKSPRHIDLATAEVLGRQAQGKALKVALTVDADDAALAAIVAALNPDLLQLHGHESPERVAAIRARFGLPVMKAIGVAHADDLKDVQAFASVAPLAWRMRMISRMSKPLPRLPTASCSMPSRPRTLPTPAATGSLSTGRF